MLLVQSSVDTGTFSERLTRPVFEEGTSLRRIQDSGIVRIGVAPDVPGFSTRNPQTKRFQGLDISLARRLAQAIFGGTVFDAFRAVRFIETPIPERLDALQEDRVDFVVSIFAETEQRRKVVAFTGPYFGSAITALTRVDDKITQLSDLADQPVAALEGGIAEQVVKRQKLGSQLVLFPNHTQLIAALKAREVAAVIGAAAVFEEVVRRNEGALEFHHWQLDSVSFSVGVPKGDDQLRDFLDARVRDLVEWGFLSLAEATRT